DYYCSTWDTSLSAHLF
nr:immunoglobulin light chain junction region [Macaca mulatta]